MTHYNVFILCICNICIVDPIFRAIRGNVWTPISHVVDCNKPRFFISPAAINFYRSDSATFQRRPPYLILLPAKAIQRNFYYYAQIRSLLVLCARSAVARKGGGGGGGPGCVGTTLISDRRSTNISQGASAEPKVCARNACAAFSRVRILRGASPRRLSYHTKPIKQMQDERVFSSTPDAYLKMMPNLKNSPFALTRQMHPAPICGCFCNQTLKEIGILE